MILLFDRLFTGGRALDGRNDSPAYAVNPATEKGQFRSYSWGTATIKEGDGYTLLTSLLEGSEDCRAQRKL